MFKKIISAAKIGFNSGVKRAYNPEKKGYELDLDTLKQEVLTESYSDKDILKLYREFCRKYDPGIEMSGTNQLLALMITTRPNMKNLI